MKRSSSTTAKRRLTTGLILCIIPALVVVYLLLRPHPSRQDKLLPAYKYLKTPAYQTQVPRSYHVTLSSNPKRPEMTQAVAAQAKTDGWQIGITYNALPPGGLSELPDYKLRLSRPTEYKQLHDPAFPKDSTLFLKQGTTSEYLLYMMHDSHYASVYVTGKVAPRLLYPVLRHVYETWQWRSPSSGA
jgi:hypothetical protein